jgi:hypothetical protein
VSTIDTPVPTEVGTSDALNVVEAPAVMVTVSVRDVKPVADVVTVRVPAGALAIVNCPFAAVVADTPPTDTVAPAIGWAFCALVINPVRVPVGPLTCALTGVGTLAAIITGAA